MTLNTITSQNYRLNGVPLTFTFSDRVINSVVHWVCKPTIMVRACWTDSL